MSFSAATVFDLRAHALSANAANCQQVRSFQDAIERLSEEEMPKSEVDRFGRRVVEDDDLPELTGELLWPGRSKRRP